MRIIVDIKVPEGLTQEQQDSFLSNLWAGMRKTGFVSYSKNTRQMWIETKNILIGYELINNEQYNKLHD